MDIKYKKNCQLYYDDDAKATFIVKRNKKFKIVNSPSEYEVLLKIISKSVKKAALEEVIDEKLVDNKKALQYVKLLLDKGILYIYHDTEYRLEDELQDYIISNFDQHYEILDFISKSKIAVKADPILAGYYKKMGLNIADIYIWSDETDDLYDIYIGTFEDEELQQLTAKGKHVLQLRRVDEACSILYMNSFDPEVMEQYRNFYISSPSVSGFSQIILPINILFHLLENVFTKGSKNLRYIAADAAVQLFDLKEMNKASLQYYDRTNIAKNSELAVIREIEEMAKTNPNLIKATNKDNTGMKHAPVCNYEITFGCCLNNQKYLRYHEDNARAGILAITDGLEQELSNINPSEFWVCGISLEEYYLKGYLRVLETLETPKEPGILEVISDDITALIDYIGKSYHQKVRLYYQDIHAGISGNLYIMDAKDQILYRKRNVWCIENDIKDGLYDIIGRCENGLKLQGEVLTWHGAYKTKPGDRTAEDMLAYLKNYFTSKQVLIDEHPWVYQSSFEKAGVHIGRFYIVR